MNQNIKIHKFNGQSVKGFIEFPIMNGRKSARIEILKRKIQDSYFYVSETIKGAGAVFGTFTELQNKYVALRDVTEQEILGEIA